MSAFFAPNHDPMDGGTLFVTPREPFDFMRTARGLVFDYVKQKLSAEAVAEFTEEDVTVFWFSKNDDDWRAALTVAHQDDYFYRVVHNSATNETQFDVYIRFDSQVL
jgi:hypothetical protein